MHHPADPLANYRTLIERVDDLCRRIAERFGAAMACGPGCSDCCRHLTLTLVESHALAAAVRALPPDEAERIRALAQAATADSPCPLLEDNLCLLYEARPLICRTHGYPLLLAEGNERRVDFCPENFRSIDRLPGDAVIDLDRLNTLLAAIDAHFAASCSEQETAAPRRRTLAEALLLDGD